MNTGYEGVASPTTSNTRVVAGRYRVGSLLGRGSMGSVYVAHHVLTGHPVALKLLSPEVSQTPQGRIRFQREIRIASAVNHAGIVQVIDAGEDPEHDSFFIAMELLSGEDFKLRSERPDFDWTQGIRILRETLDPLIAAHEHGFVHRDLKPENIYLHRPDPGAPERVKILDFGIARDQAEEGGTRTNVALGTPYYMSPEQATNAKAVGPASDVWSIGVMLHWVVSGKLPFYRDTAFNTLTAVCTQPPPPIDDRGSETLQRLAGLITRCLDKDPEHRPNDARALAGELDAILGSWQAASSQEAAGYRRMAVTVEAPAHSVPKEVTAVAFSPPTGELIWSAKPKRAALGIILGGLVVVAGLGGWAYHQIDRETTRPEAANVVPAKEVAPENTIELPSEPSNPPAQVVEVPIDTREPAVEPPSEPPVAPSNRFKRPKRPAVSKRPSPKPLLIKERRPVESNEDEMVMEPAPAPSVEQQLVVDVFDDEEDTTLKSEPVLEKKIANESIGVESGMTGGLQRRGEEKAAPAKEPTEKSLVPPKRSKKRKPKFLTF